ncbi:hypothetical protein CoNPh12_CDS0176 [Staphylococcus phage S-CoN_Ph12]|nr:hypothetical protein CoNPh12_CDS0176 [Staphylococcus phage S-CoN_Ph12]
MSFIFYHPFLVFSNCLYFNTLTVTNQLQEYYKNVTK